MENEMYELTINDTVYRFKFGVGFVREISRTKQLTLDNGMKEDAGLEYAVAKLQEGDVITLVDVLDLGNKYAGEPRITKAAIEDYIDSEAADVDGIFESVLDFFSKGNATKKKTKLILEAATAATK